MKPIEPGLPLLFLFCLFLSFSGSLCGQSIKAFNPQSGEELQTDELPNIVQFKVVNLDPPPRNPNSNKNPKWAFLWDFGDCSFPSTDRNPVHAFAAEEDDYDVSVTLTPIYSDEDEDLPSFTLQISVVGPYNSETASYTDTDLLDDEAINITHVRDCKAGELSTFLIPYENTLSQAWEQGELIFKYSAEHLAFDTNYMNGCGYIATYDHTTSANGRNATLTFDLPSMPSGEEGFIAISLVTKSNVAIGTEITLTAQINSETNGTLIGTDTLVLTTVSSHDPNSKAVYQAQKCSIDSLTYMINFENEGTSDAELVYIIDEVHPWLDMTTVKMLHTSHGSTSYSICDTVAIDTSFNPHFLNFANNQTLMVLRDTTNRKLAFVYQNIDLEPSRFADASSLSIDTNSNQKQGTGSLSYSILRDTNLSTPPSGPFGTHAEIFFDDNYPIATNPAFARGNLCYCIPSANTSNNNWIEAVKVNGSLNTSGNNGGYSDYSHVQFQAQRGGVVPLELNPGLSSMQMVNHWSVHIDFDHNGSFEMQELIYSSAGVGQLTPIISIPNWATNGSAMLRVTMGSTATSDPCIYSVDGETEDYSITILDPMLPDLKIADKFIDRNTVFSDSMVQIQLTVQNLGPANQTNPADIHYFLSKDSKLSLEDVFLHQTTVSQISAGNDTVDTSWIQVPPNPYGTYYIIAVIDPFNTLAENQKENNTEYFQVLVDEPKPDLTIPSTSICQTVIRPGQQLNYSLTIKNDGERSADQDLGFIHTVAFLSGDRKLDFMDQPIDTLKMAHLGKNKSIQFHRSVCIPNNIQSGQHFLIFSCDDQKVIEERFENNNIASQTFSVSHAPAAAIPYYTSFECSDLDGYWNIPSGAIAEVSSSLPGTAYRGARLLSIQPSDTDSLRFAECTIDASVSPQLYLSFQWKDFSPADSSQDDAVLISDDGLSFIQICRLQNPDTFWNEKLLNLGVLASYYGLQLNSNFTVRFQHRSLDTTSRGFAFDHLQVSTIQPSMKRNENDEREVLLDPKKVTAFPNPFAQQTTIRFYVPEDETLVSVNIYDLNGQRILEAFSMVPHASGTSEIWLPRNGLTAGIYICEVRIGSSRSVVKLMVSGE